MTYDYDGMAAAGSSLEGERRGKCGRNLSRTGIIHPRQPGICTGFFFFNTFSPVAAITGRAGATYPVVSRRGEKF